uniref:Uncharacterized protein n=1 Tax=Aegilops tauschii subsp. strangulata TaxID=200361 RepID=A0A452YD07_AEGTS
MTSNSASNEVLANRFSPESSSSVNTTPSVPKCKTLFDTITVSKNILHFGTEGVFSKQDYLG